MALRELGRKRIQGYLLSRPAPADELERLIGSAAGRTGAGSADVEAGGGVAIRV